MVQRRESVYAEETRKVIDNNYMLTRAILTSLDILLALLIIVSANKLADNLMGKLALIFGFVMIAIVTTLKILKHL